MARNSAQQQDSGSGPQHPGFPLLFGKYVLVRPLARGGMGELFLAAAGETDGFEKMCVVKKVLHSVADQGVHRRFLDEAKVVVRLNHPNLVQVFDAGRVDEEYYLAMELVEGKDLRAVWNRCAQLHRRIAVDVAIYVVREVLRGLEYAHDAGKLHLVHRDISPPNILVGYRGDVKLTDFGLAKSAIKKEMTTPGVVFGRYSYLSPEQARGLSADRRTDLYACGIVLWELLTGRQLFPSANRNHQEALAAVRDPDVKPPSQLVPGIPDGLDDVVLQGLAKDPRDRYQNAAAFRSALSDVLAEHFPKADADRASEFMRDIFAREVRMEARDISNISHQSFGEMRATGDDSELISINELMASHSASGTMSLRDSDIVELEKARRGGAPPRLQDLEASAQQWVGKIVAARYRIDSLIGIGGMGAVFSATHMALGKTFALKVLHPLYTRDPDIVDRFMREARAATQTGHPNIIDVVDIGTTEEDDVYFVMELLQGRTLAEVLGEDGPLAVRRAVHIARQICRALAATHEVGIIHRDLKTDNIILTTVGKDPDFVKVLDFGICKTSTDASTTSPGMVMGSPDYMAPEQGAGLPATVASDVYAAGCVLFEMLAGQLPFSGRNAIDVLMQKGARDAERVTAYRPEVPEPVAEVIAHCLLRDAGDRPQSMRSLEYELTRAVDGRAQAVAAVLGLNMAGDSAPRSIDDPAPDASASFHRAAIASLDSGPTAVMPPPVSDRDTEVALRPGPGGLRSGPERTVIAPPPSRPAGPTSTRSPAKPEGQLSKANTAALAAAKAVFFVLLGGALVGAFVVARDDPSATAPPGRLSPDPAPTPAPAGDEAEAAASPAAGAAGDSSGGGALVASDGEPPDPAPPEPAAVHGGDDDPILVEDPPTPTAETAPELIALAEQALEAGQWREPPESSVAMALAKLGWLDPGNEAIARLRRKARDHLLPLAERAQAKKQWADAVTAYRDLLAVWPDHEARVELIKALSQHGKVVAKEKDWAAALATADELLNYDEEDFTAVMLRGDALSNLSRHDEARDAYARALKLKPRSRLARKKRARAAKKARRDN